MTLPLRQLCTLKTNKLDSKMNEIEQTAQVTSSDKIPGIKFCNRETSQSKL